jgi:lactate permease
VTNNARRTASSFPDLEKGRSDAIGAPPSGSRANEGELFRKVLCWSLVLILAMCALVHPQSTAVLDWMVVK